jgi:alpha-D-xyloside xylohydrolase
MNSNNKRDVYLPEGEWVNFFSGAEYEGKQWLNDFECPMEEMPVWVKRGADITVYPYQVNNTDEINLSKAAGLKIDENYKGLTESLLKDIWN